MLRSPGFQIWEKAACSRNGQPRPGQSDPSPLGDSHSSFAEVEDDITPPGLGFELGAGAEGLGDQLQLPPSSL